jgi:hypothetical protein
MAVSSRIRLAIRVSRPSLARAVSLPRGEGGAFEAARNVGQAQLTAFPASTPFARHVLAIGAAQYAPLVEANARALAEGSKAAEVETYGETTSYLARAYPEQSRQMIQRRVRDQLNPEERHDVEAWLKELGLGCFLP